MQLKTTANIMLLMFSTLCLSESLLAQTTVPNAPATDALCGSQTCKSMNRLVTNIPLSDANWIKVESTAERGDLFFDANIQKLADAEIKIAKSEFDSGETTTKKTSLGMSRLLVNLPALAMSPPHLVFIDEWDMSPTTGPVKRDKPLIAQSIVFNYEFDCASNVYRITDSAAYTEPNAKGVLVIGAASSPMFDIFRSVNDLDGKPAGNREFS